MADLGFFTIGFDSEAGETAEFFIHRIKSYCVRITDADGGELDYEVVGHGEWNGHEGMPVQVKAWSESAGKGVGPVMDVDAKHILVY